MANQINKNVFTWSIIVALGGFLFGFDTAVISGVEQHIQQLFQLSSFLHGFTISSALDWNGYRSSDFRTTCRPLWQKAYPFYNCRTVCNYCNRKRTGWKCNLLYNISVSLGG